MDSRTWRVCAVLYNARMGRVRVTYQGRVQGVCFRATARRIAASHGLVGWVRNEPDGSVIAEAQGSESAIAGFLADVRAHFVRHIRSETTEAMPESGDATAFTIDR